MSKPTASQETSLKDASEQYQHQYLERERKKQPKDHTHTVKNECAEVLPDELLHFGRVRVRMRGKRARKGRSKAPSYHPESGSGCSWLAISLRAIIRLEELVYERCQLLPSSTIPVYDLLFSCGGKCRELLFRIQRRALVFTPVDGNYADTSPGS